MKLKAILLGTLVASALFVSTSASANGVSIGWGPGGHVSYTVTIGQPHHYVQPYVVVAPQYRHPRKHVRNHHRHWRPIVRQHRHDRHERRGNHHRHHRNDRHYH